MPLYILVGLWNKCLVLFLDCCDASNNVVYYSRIKFVRVMCIVLSRLSMLEQAIHSCHIGVTQNLIHLLESFIMVPVVASDEDNLSLRVIYTAPFSWSVRFFWYMSCVSRTRFRLTPCSAQGKLYVQMPDPYNHLYVSHIKHYIFLPPPSSAPLVIVISTSSLQKVLRYLWDLGTGDLI